MYKVFPDTVHVILVDMNSGEIPTGGDLRLEIPEPGLVSLFYKSKLNPC